MGKYIHRHAFIFCKLQEPENTNTDTPKVDAAVASSVKDIAVASEVCFFPKDTIDSKMKITLIRDFESSLVTATCFARAIVSWMDDLKTLMGRDQPDFPYALK